MSRFNAATAVERLEYDFTEYGGSEGYIPEPSTDRINAFFSNVKVILKETKAMREVMTANENGNLTPEETEAAMEAVTGSDFTKQMQSRMTEVVAELCGAEPDADGNLQGGSPSVADLEKLPFRVASAFNQWLMGELRPKTTTPGTKR